MYHPAKFGHLLEPYDPRAAALATPPPSATIPPDWAVDPTARAPRFLLCHSSDDDVVSAEYGAQAWRLLEAMGLRGRYHENAVGMTRPKHWLAVPRGPNDIAVFIEKNLQRCPHYYDSKTVKLDEDGRVIPRPTAMEVERSGQESGSGQSEGKGSEEFHEDGEGEEDAECEEDVEGLGLSDEDK